MRIVRPMERAVYVVTDIECDGPAPGRNSMIAFASVAVTADGAEQGRFEAVLEPLPGAERDPQTWAWWNTQPEALAAATAGARPAAEVLAAFVAWVRGFDDGRVFTAYPLAFDGGWIDHYLRRFTACALVAGHFEEDPLFDGPGLCLKAYAAGITGLPHWRCTPQSLPPEWFGGHAHTHRAIDDALGYAALLGNLTREAGSRRP
jgi:hypothetical protein